MPRLCPIARYSDHDHFSKGNWSIHCCTRACACVHAYQITHTFSCRLSSSLVLQQASDIIPLFFYAFLSAWRKSLQWCQVTQYWALLQVGHADPPVSARQSATVPVQLLYPGRPSCNTSASAVCCATSSQHLRSSGIRCRWSDDVQHSAK